MGSVSSSSQRPQSLAGRRIGHVGLRVSDLEKSRKFYREILGLENKTKGAKQAFVPIGSDMLALFTSSDSVSDFHFGFRLDSPSQVDEWRNWLRSNDVRIYEDIAEDDHPRSFKFKDPDGHWIEISSRS